MNPELDGRPDRTAVWTALWRALHVEVDPPPHVITDVLGAQLLDPTGRWRRRPEAAPQALRRARASIVARARLVEDLVAERAELGVEQYVILGAGLDTFALRRADLGVRVFEIDRPGAQAWKCKRLVELGLVVPGSLRFVPVDFEADDDWWAQLVAAGFDPGRPTVVSSMGVVPYLTPGVVFETMSLIAGLPPGSALAMTFLLPLELTDPEERPRLSAARAEAKAVGAPFVSFFAPPEMVSLARDAGFADVRHVSAAELAERYFAVRTDGLRPSSSEELIVATTGSPPGPA